MKGNFGLIILGASYLLMLFVIATAFVLEKQTDRALSLIIVLTVTILSILMFEADQFRGIWQRLIFIICFGWMIYNFSKT